MSIKLLALLYDNSHGAFIKLYLFNPSTVCTLKQIDLNIGNLEIMTPTFSPLTTCLFLGGAPPFLKGGIARCLSHTAHCILHTAH